MMRLRLSGWVLGLIVLAAGCAGMSPIEPEPGGSKGPEMKVTMAQGQRSGSASQMNQSTPNADASLARMPCGEGLACTGLGGCVGSCDPNAGTQTACAACDNTTFTDCTQRACTP